MSFVRELKRRNVFRVGIAYLVVAWLILQLSDVLISLLELPDWIGRTAVFVLIVGFPVVCNDVPDDAGYDWPSRHRLRLMLPNRFFSADWRSLSAQPEGSCRSVPHLKSTAPVHSSLLPHGLTG